MSTNHFKTFAFTPTIERVIERLRFVEPTNIQEKVIPHILKGDSVIGQSRTGSGKTHAFLLPLMDQLKATQEVQIVITAPTRELASQLFNEVKKVIEFSGKENEWTAKRLIGGTDKQKMMEKLKNPPQIIVGTPGRILDMVNEGALSIYSASSFVIDEADLMLDLGFIHEVDQLLVRAKKDIQIVAFSATIPERLQQFFKKYLDHPHYVKADDDHFSPETMQHQLIAGKYRDESSIIFEISKLINPYLAIIFVNGKEKANELTDTLLQQGLNVGVLHGGLTPRERKRALKDIEQLRYQYLVATDLASRGIHIEGVSHVINAELPKEEEFYIHRVGRTARAGMEGTAISIYREEDLKIISKLEEKGLTFSYTDIKNGEWVEVKPWYDRRTRAKKTDSLDKEAWKRVKRPKKVKPGYKKKMKKQQEAIKKRLEKKGKYRK